MKKLFFFNFRRLLLRGGCTRFSANILIYNGKYRHLATQLFGHHRLDSFENDVEHIRLLSNGNIGTDRPEAKLHIEDGEIFI